MADGKVRIETELDQAGFKSGLQKLAQTVKTQTASIKKSFADIGKNAKLKIDTTGFETGTKKVKSYSQALRDELKSVNKQVADLSKQYRQSASESGVYSDKTKELADKLKKAKDKQSELTEEIKKGSSAMEKYSFNIGSVADMAKSGFTAIAKAAAVGLAAITAGVATLSGLSISAYADYEQLVGGVETIFGAGGQSLEEYAASVNKTVEEAQSEFETLMKSQQTVMDNADKAYQTAGMSANDYMKTVTGFSASLLQSLNGDTQKAAEYADRALVDMADNSNKYGTNIEDIQNAYQGFAKQNYTMLDNLKLGYGGTKEEMQRLVKDASKLKDVQEELGVTVDGNSLSFANIINAISVMQEEMGIAGTTSKEAATTISGSTSSMKAAWENLLVALASDDMDVGTYVSRFADSVITVGKNLAPRIKEVLPSIAEAIGEIVDELGPYVSETIVDLLPALITGAATIAASLVEQIPNIFATVAEAIKQVFVNAMESAPEETSASLQNLANVLTNLLPVITGLTSAIITFRTAMTISAIVAGVTEAIQKFKAANEAATISQALLNYVMNLNPFILIATLIAGVVTALITLWNTNEGFRNAVISAWEAVKSGISNAIESVKTAINNVVEFFKNLGSTIEQTFNDVLEKCKTFGRNIIEKIKEGLASAVDGLTSWFNGILDGIFKDRTVNVKVNKTTSDVDGSHANGLNYVPFDGYIAELHKGEMVLTRSEANSIRRLLSSGLSRIGTAMNPTIPSVSPMNSGTNPLTVIINGNVDDPDVIARRIRQEQRYGLAGAKG